jgi:hypothetical protein
MLKVKQLLSTANMVESTNNGKYSILTKRVRKKPLDLMMNSDSTEIDHSTLFQDFQ